VTQLAEPIAVVDRWSRGFERAVLASSLAGGDPVVLDRTPESLAHLDRYLDAMAGAGDRVDAAHRERLLGAYLLMVRIAALGTAGSDQDQAPREAARERVQRRAPLARYGEALQRAAQGRRVEVERLRVFTLRTLFYGSIRKQWEQIKSLCIAWLPSFLDGEDVEEDGEDKNPQERTIRWIVDPDEQRIDLELSRHGDEDGGMRLSVTAPFAPGVDVAERWTGLWRNLESLAPLQDLVLGLAIDPDTLDGMNFLRRGVTAAMPPLLFFTSLGIHSMGGADVLRSAPADVTELLSGSLRIMTTAAPSSAAEYFRHLDGVGALDF
jgi:hypothetical protein